MKSKKIFFSKEIDLQNVYGGMNGTTGTGECHGTGCKQLKHEGKIIDWDDAECGDIFIGKNSGKCDPVAYAAY